MTEPSMNLHSGLRIEDVCIFQYNSNCLSTPFCLYAGIDRILSHQSPGGSNQMVMPTFRYSRADPPPHDLPAGKCCLTVKLTFC